MNEYLSSYVYVSSLIDISLRFLTYSQFLVESWDMLSAGDVNGRKAYLKALRSEALCKSTPHQDWKFGIGKLVILEMLRMTSGHVT
jgi:hypothetical protein